MGFFYCVMVNIMNMYKSIKILYEDNHLIVVVKPAGIPSQADKTGDEDMLSLLKLYIKEKYNKPGDVYLGLVHRLDRMTSGIMVFARTSKAASRLSKNIREGDFKKRYLAVLNGYLQKEQKSILLENYLVKDERNNISKVTNKDVKNSKLASLEYKVLDNFIANNKEYTYVEVKLNTGRHHQIRVQFSNIGHSLYGDIKYGKNVNKTGQKLALFAYNLSFFHPTKDEVMEFRVLPESNGIWSELKEWK